MCEKYSGWTNQETWLVNLWIDNDQGLYEMSREVIKGCGYDPGTWGAGDALKDFIDELREMTEHQLEAGLFSDLLNCALGSVNWQEITDHYEIDDLEDKEE